MKSEKEKKELVNETLKFAGQILYSTYLICDMKNGITGNLEFKNEKFSIKFERIKDPC